ncbi:hypothetical protein HELRODRAFT_77701 [Helobdella robusta]|uniref:CUE domain-containing protein n=1 Tax=Helobdella robusta TaxID=6412 RepID=T1G325_HELRO|nr:hypothetical protein HELRODRAFT_77701 [Helobdella robusta]ESO05356.1 hypothetical protein HELRODRAFT_77701 [Helobdella robusta]
MLLLVYLPFGMLLFSVRVIYSIEVYILSCILPKDSIFRQYLLRPMSIIMGIFIRTEQSQSDESDVKIVVANYTTHFDHAVMQLVHPYHMVSTWNLSEVTLWLFGYNDMGAKQGKEVLIRNTKKYLKDASVPLLIFPEGETTNGKCGLLKFSAWPFSLENKVQPVAIKVQRPLFNVPLSLVHSNVVSDIFWLLFFPITIFHLSYLPVQQIGDDEDSDEFSKRVQKMIARKLNMQATNYTHADKLELVKKIAANKNKNINDRPPVKQSRDSLDHMTKQVMNVLPHVSDHVIRNDLALTKDVELTISNILEGKICQEQDFLQPEKQNTQQQNFNKSSSHVNPVDPQLKISNKSPINVSIVICSNILSNEYLINLLTFRLLFLLNFNLFLLYG